MRYLKTSFLFFAWCFGTRLVVAQSVDSVQLPVYTYASFLYDFPQSFGATASITLPLNSRHIFIKKNGKERQKFRRLLTRSEAGFYHYSFNNTGILFLQSIGFSYHHTTPWFFEWTLTAGLLRTFYDGTVYKVSDDGTVSTLKNFGRLYGITGMTITFGSDLEKRSKPLPFTFSLQPSLWIQYPYNNYFLLHFSTRLSIGYHFSDFNRLVHQKTVERGFKS